MPKKTFDQLSKRQRRQIFKTCCGLFAQNGFANTSMKMITKRLRVADGYLYYYFEGKKDIARWVITVGTDLWHDHFKRHVDGPSPNGLTDLFKLSVLQGLRFTREHPDIYGAYCQMVNEPNFALAEYLVEQTRWIDRMYQGAIEREIASGKVRSDIPPDLIAMLWDVVNTRLQEFCYNPSLDPIGVSTMTDNQLERLIDKLISLLRDGMDNTYMST